MNTQQQDSERIAIIRAIPHPPHKYRWCGMERWVPDEKARPQQEMRVLPGGGFAPVYGDDGKPIPAKHALPWPSFDVKAKIVANPAPYDPNANGGLPIEISPATLKMLERDPRISVRVLGEGGDAAEIIRAKDDAAKAEADLFEARRQLAGYSERSERAQRSLEEQAAASGRRIAELEAELAAAHAKIAKK